MRLYVYCEGQSEKIFADRLLAPFFRKDGIEIKVILANNKKGGIANYAQFKRELIRLCDEHSNEYVTTMIDYSPVKNLQIAYERYNSE